MMMMTTTTIRLVGLLFSIFHLLLSPQTPWLRTPSVATGFSGENKMPCLSNTPSSPPPTKDCSHNGKEPLVLGTSAEQNGIYLFLRSLFLPPPMPTSRGQWKLPEHYQKLAFCLMLLLCFLHILWSSDVLAVGHFTLSLDNARGLSVVQQTFL